MYWTYSAPGNYTKKKPMFHRLFSMFKLNDKVNTSVTTAGQSWPNYIGPKREKTQACLTNTVYALFPWRWRGLESPLLFPHSFLLVQFNFDLVPEFPLTWFSILLFSTKVPWCPDTSHPSPCRPWVWPTRPPSSLGVGCLPHLKRPPRPPPGPMNDSSYNPWTSVSPPPTY